MNRLDNFLAETSDSKFNELFHRIEIARLLRTIEQKYNKSPEEMRTLLKLSQDMYSRWRRGAVDFSVKNMASIEILDKDLYAEQQNMFQIKLDQKEK